METNYTTKEELIRQLEELRESEDPAEAYFKAKVLSRKWRNAREDEESFYEKELSDRFNAIMDELAEKAGDVEISVEDRKNQIIAKAKEIAAGNNFKKGNEQMQQLMEEWKQSGRLNKEKDDELWAQFKEARNEFFERKNEYFANLKETFAANKALKEELIEKAKAVLELENIKEAAKQTGELMEEWKKVGSAGHRDDEKLWQEFLAERKAFYDKRDAFYDNMKETYAKRVAEKKELEEKWRKLKDEVARRKTEILKAAKNIAHGQALSFSDIEQVMNLTYVQEETGDPFVVALVLMDSGDNTDIVYDFCASNSDWCLPSKGSSHAMQAHFHLSVVNRTDSKAYGMSLVMVDTGKYKDMIAGRLQKENGVGSWMVYNGVDLEYANQVTSEHKINVRSGNTTKLAWKTKTTHAANHYLDCEVYAMCAADVLGARTLHLQEAEIEARTEIKQQQTTQSESSPETENWLGVQEADQWI